MLFMTSVRFIRKFCSYLDLGGYALGCRGDRPLDLALCAASLLTAVRIAPLALPNPREAITKAFLFMFSSLSSSYAEGPPSPLPTPPTPSCFSPDGAGVRASGLAATMVVVFSDGGGGGCRAARLGRLDLGGSS